MKSSTSTSGSRESGIYSSNSRDASRCSSPPSSTLSFKTVLMFLPYHLNRTLASNIRTRRGSKVAINVPIFHDTNTPRPFVDPSIPYDRDLYPGDHEAKDGAALKDHIYMDAMAFGMGCCCLQITFQATDLKEATTVYDALVPVAPIMVSFEASRQRSWACGTGLESWWNLEPRIGCEAESLIRFVFFLSSARYECRISCLSRIPRRCRLSMGRHCWLRR